MADWANLLPELLARIAQRLAAYDFIVFCVVCKAWQSASHTLEDKPPLAPWLVLAEEQKVGIDDIFFCPVCKIWYSAAHTLKGKPLIPSWFMLGEEEKAEVDDIFYCFNCTTYQSCCNSKEKSPPLPPWFVLADEDRKVAKDAPNIRRFFNLSTLKTYEFELPEVSGRNCMRASYRCILTLGPDLQINLVNPFTHKQIPLPPMLTFSHQYNYDHKFTPQEYFENFVMKVTLSSNPWIKKSSRDDDFNKHDCVVAALYGPSDELAFARPGDEMWTDIGGHSKSFQDVIFYKDKFYAVDCRGGAAVCDMDDDNDGNIGLRAKKIAAKLPSGMRYFTKKYLVESSGDLLLVSRSYDGVETDDGEMLYHRTVGFSVMNLDECTSCDNLEEDDDGISSTSSGSSGGSSGTYPYKWTEVDSLGDVALFLGRNPSFSLPASKFCGSLKANCIYFIDDNELFCWDKSGGGDHDMGIFSMENGTIEPHYSGDSCHPVFPPFWFT